MCSTDLLFMLNDALFASRYKRLGRIKKINYWKRPRGPGKLPNHTYMRFAQKHYF